MDVKIESFLTDSSDFRDAFEPKFVDYFINLCLSYDKFYSREILAKIALLVYKDVFSIDAFHSTDEQEIFSEMRDDGLMLSFLINRSMFFLIENYTKEENSNKHIEALVICATDYISEFEKQICNKHRLQPIHVNFDTQENFLVGNNILDVFKRIKERGEEVTFFNLYKGVPIRHSAVVVDIVGEDVAFKTMQTQEIAMKMDGNAYILTDNNFDKPIKADIVHHNFSSSTIVLNNFTYLLNMPATKREFIRVHPDIMAEVSLASEKDLVTTGKLFDLSVDGLGVISEENNGIYAGARIELHFKLDISRNQEPFIIEVDGEVLNIIEYSSSYRYCIKIYPTVEMKEKITNYVNLREVEILNSLEEEVNSYKV